MLLLLSPAAPSTWVGCVVALLAPGSMPSLMQQPGKITGLPPACSVLADPTCAAQHATKVLARDTDFSSCIAPCSTISREPAARQGLLVAQLSSICCSQELEVNDDDLVITLKMALEADLRLKFYEPSTFGVWRRGLEKVMSLIFAPG